MVSYYPNKLQFVREKNLNDIQKYVILYYISRIPSCLSINHPILCANRHGLHSAWAFAPTKLNWATT